MRRLLFLVLTLIVTSVLEVPEVVPQPERQIQNFRMSNNKLLSMTLTYQSIYLTMIYFDYVKHLALLR